MVGVKLNSNALVSNLKFAKWAKAQRVMHP